MSIDAPPPAPPAKKSNRNRNCCGGCLFLLVLIPLCGALFFWQGENVARIVGLAPPSAEELYDTAPDRFAAESINNTLLENDVTGVDVIVLPKTDGSGGSTALFTISEDAATRDFSSQEEAEDFLRDLMSQMADQNDNQNLNIDEVAFDFTGPEGQSLINVAAPADAAAAYSRGEISREEFLRQVEIDWTNLFSVQDLIQAIEEGESQ